MTLKLVIYDMDGTSIESSLLHEGAWKYALSKTRTAVPPDFLEWQRGRATEDAASALSSDPRVIDEIVAEKQQYVMHHLSIISMKNDFIKTVYALQLRNLKVGICTAASRDFVDKIFKAIPPLALFSESIICSEDSVKRKPHPEPLLLLMEKTQVTNPQDCVYIGDSVNDYLAAKAAQCHFINYLDAADSSIPATVPVISDHYQLLAYLDNLSPR